MYTTYLQKAVYHLPTHIFFVCYEEFTLQHAKNAFCNAVVGFEVLVCSGSTVVAVLRVVCITLVAGGDIEKCA